jgi:hypothetical protein
MAIHFQQLWKTIYCFFIRAHFQGLDGSWRRAEAGRCSNAAYADFDPSSPAECKDPLAAAASTLLIAFVINVILQPERERILTICVCLQGHLLEALHCMAQASPIAVIGETIWGDEVGAVYVLQVEVFSDARVCSSVTAQRVDARSRSGRCSAACSTSPTASLPFDLTFSARPSCSSIL